MTNGGDKDVTTRKTERARVDKPDTTISPPGLHVEQTQTERARKEEIYETSRTLNIYFITFTKQSCLSEPSDPRPNRHVSILCFRDLGATLSVAFLSRRAASEAAAVGESRVYCRLELS